jgi:hypothetical protein
MRSDKNDGCLWGVHADRIHPVKDLFRKIDLIAEIPDDNKDGSLAKKETVRRVVDLLACVRWREQRVGSEILKKLSN